MAIEEKLIVTAVAEGFGDIDARADSMIDRLDDIEGATEGAGRGVEKLSSSMIDMKKVNQDASGALGVFGVDLNALNSPLTMVAGALKGAIDKALEWGGAVDKLATNTGMSAEAASLMAATFENAGVSMTTTEGAMKALAKNGVAPNIESIKRLAAEWQAIDDPVKKAAFATENFGRSALEMTEILSKTPAELQALSDAARTSGKVLTEEVVQQMEDAQVAFAEFQQRVDGLSVTVGVRLVNGLMSAADALEQIAIIDAIAIVQIAQKTGAISKQEAEIKILALATEGLSGVTKTYSDHVEEQNAFLRIHAAEERGAAGATIVLSGNLSSTVTQLIGYGTAIQTANDKTAAMAQATLDADTKFENFKIGMAGAVDGEMADYEQKQGALRDRAAELVEKIEVLSGKKYLTPAQKEEIAGMRAELLENNTAFQDNAAAHTLASKTILFNLLEQKLSVGGLTTFEQQVLQETATRWGLVGAASLASAQNVDQAMAESGGDVEKFIEILARLEGKSPINLNVNTSFTQSGSPPAQYGSENFGGAGSSTSTGFTGGGNVNTPTVGPTANGGPVTAGDRLWVGERGPEPFIPAINGRILSHADAMAAISDGQQGAGAGSFQIGPFYITDSSNPTETARAISSIIAAKARELSASGYARTN